MKKKRDEQTSPRVGTLAAKVLGDSKSTATQKSIAGSALTQRPDKPKPYKKGWMRPPKG